MDPELLRVLVPLGVFAFWALSRLSERNVKPLEPRGPRLPDIPRPQPQQPTLRWSNQVNGPNPVAGARRDEILILGEEVRAPRPVQRRAQPRQKQSQQPRPQQQQKPARQRKATDVSTDIGRTLKESMAIAPLSVAATTPLSMSTPAAAAVQPASPTTSPFALNLRKALTEPERVREAILINEILQPPLALRRRR